MLFTADQIWSIAPPSKRLNEKLLPREAVREALVASPEVSTMMASYSSAICVGTIAYFTTLYCLGNPLDPS